jgi:undecaprenyl-diphosphatase
MTILQAIILGIIEGITEFLPISSTAHLIISSKWLKIPNTNTLNSFLIAIQLGAILSVAVLYARLIIKNPRIILKIAAAFIPTALIGLAAYKLVKNVFMNNIWLIAIMLIVGGVVLLFLENFFQTNKKQLNDSTAATPELEMEKISYKQAFLIGLFQTLAIVPGISRSAATIMGGLSLGLSRRNIVEFSFLLALPTMAAATFLDLYQEPPQLQGDELNAWIVGLIVAFITAVFSIRFLLRFIQKNNFSAFGWYRIGIGLIIILTLIF